MRILLLSDFFYPHISGGAIARFKFAKEAVERGHIVDVFSPLREGYEKEEEIDGVRIKRPFQNKPPGLVPDNPIALFTRLFYSILFFFFLARWLKKNEADFIHTTEHVFHPVGKLLGSIFEIPVLSFVGYTPALRDDEKENRSSNFEERFIFKHYLGEKVLCRSEKLKTMIEELSSSEVKVVHGVVNLERVEEAVESTEVGEKRKEIGFGSEDILLTMVGRLAPVKNIKKGVEILSDLPERYKLIIVGDGPEKEDIERKIERSGLKKRIRMTGSVPHKEALKLIGLSDLVMLTSKAEAYPTVAFEGLTMGKKVISTPVGILKEISEQNLVVARTERFSDIIEDLCFEDRKMKIDRNIASKYSMERYTEEILDFIRVDDDE